MAQENIAEKTPETRKIEGKSWLGRALDRVILSVFRIGFNTLFSAQARGLEHFRNAGKKPTLIVANHVSLLDGMFLASMLPVKPVFAIDLQTYQKFNRNPLLRFLFSRVGMFPVDSANPDAIRDMTKLAKSGVPVMIFPEGRLTRDGNVMQIFDGAASVAVNAGADVIPVHIDGFEFLPYSSGQLESFPKRLLPNLSLTALPPRRIDIPPGLPRRETRKLRLEQLKAIMHELPVSARETEPALIDELHEAARKFGYSRVVLEDPEGKMTYADVLTKAYALGRFFKDGTEKGENVGMLLPNSRAAVVSFWAAQAAGRVPAMLNPKAGVDTLASCVQTARIKTVVTSRRFVELAKLEKEIEALSQTCRIVYLEDAPKKIGFFDKLDAWKSARGLLPRDPEQARGGDPALVLFTSGSEGVPKGVVLSSQNLLSNIAQTRRGGAFTPEDRVFNAMPVFHAFGIGGGVLMPMLSGCKSFQYPTPLDGKNIPKAAYFFDATVMYGTDTFLSLYARNASAKDFSRVRRIFAGAEALKAETFDHYVEKFGVVIYQGYGMTEASPVVAINGPGEHKRGSVGRVVPGMDIRLEPVPGIENGQKLLVRGPNVMLGYLKNEKPGVIQPPEDGWHDTGDIVRIDEEGFMFIVGRAKRFAKFGGEMVSLDAVEGIVRGASLKQEFMHAAVLRQTTEGDNIVLFTTDPDINRERIVRFAQENGKSILGLPRDSDIVRLREMPLLSTGKTDYVRLKALAASLGAP